MKDIKIGLQLYSVRDAFEKDINACFKRIKEIGYDGVELYGPFLYSAETIKKALEENGLEVCGYHTEYRFLDKDFINAAIAYNKTIGNNRMICPYIGVDVANTVEDYLKIAKRFCEVNELLKEHGIKSGYHAHDIDFRDVEGQMPWDIIFSNVPDDFIMQLDTGNTLASGRENPTNVLRKYPFRSETLHYKPYDSVNKYDSMICEDDLNWDEIANLTQNNTNCQYVIVEHETQDENMEHVKKCFDYLATYFKNGEV